MADAPQEEGGQVRFMKQHIALDYMVHISPLAARFGEQLRAGAAAWSSDAASSRRPSVAVLASVRERSNQTLAWGRSPATMRWTPRLL